MADDEFADEPQASNLESTSGPPPRTLGVGRMLAAAVFTLVGLTSLLQALGAGIRGNLFVAFLLTVVVLLMGLLSTRVLKGRIGAIGVAGVWLLAFVGWFYLSGQRMIAMAIRMNEYGMLLRQIGPLLLGQIGAVGLVWFLSKRIKRAGPRLLLRALALASAFTPFLPHAGVQWSSPWPPAVYWLALGISAGELPLFELTSILSFAAVIWLASLAVHYDLARHRAAAEDVAGGTSGSGVGDTNTSAGGREASRTTSARTGPVVRRTLLSIVILGVAALGVGRALGFFQAASDDREPKVVTAAFNPKGDNILTAGWDGTAKLWHADTGTELLRLEAHRDSVAHASFSHDGDRVVTASFDGSALIWDAHSGEILARLEGHRGKVMEAWFSPDGERVVTVAGMQGYLWNARSGQRIVTLGDHTSLVTGARFSPDGELAITWSWDHTARVWNGSEGTLRAVLTQESTVDFALFSPAGDRILTGDSVRATSRLWNTNGDEILKLQAPRGLHFDHAAFSPDASRIATIGMSGTVLVWDSVTGEQLHTLQSPGNNPFHLAFSPDGRHILVVGKSDGKTRIWDAATGEESAVLDSHGALGAHGSFSPDGSRVVVAHWDGTARVWDASGGEELFVLVHEPSRQGRPPVAPKASPTLNSNSSSVMSSDILILALALGEAAITSE